MTNLLLVAFVVLIAAILSYHGNRVLFRAMGARGIILGVPAWEESCKVLAILILSGNSVVPVHLFFGAVEFALSAWSGPKLGKTLGAVAMVTHASTGVLVFMVVASGQSLWVGYLLAIGLHLCLNVGVVRFVLPSLVWGEY